MIGGDALWSTELFDPLTGTFPPGPAMDDSRVSHKATLLDDGRVLVTGGFNGYCYEFDAVSGSSPRFDAQVFDPLTGSWSWGGWLTVATWPYAFTATLLSNGSVLLAGDSSTSAQRFDPTTNSMLLTPQMDQPRLNHRATVLLDGRVLITGGAMNKSAEIYAAQ